jgi:hypothetical protein
MKQKIAILAFLFCVAVGFFCLTLRVDRTDRGGITGTLVVPPGTSDEAISQTISAFRVAGAGWLAISAFCLRWVVRAFGTSYVSASSRLYPFMFRAGLLIIGIGVVGGLAFVATFGSSSLEFRRYFGYFVALYMVGTVLVIMGRRGGSR